MGDQPEAIAQLVEGVKNGTPAQTLLGVTGSGKTFTMANVIKEINRPTLILSHNKTLAAQLYNEFKGFFPNNAVEYYVSYYDYYQPEAYIPSSDTYIEKDLAINDEIDKLRLAATSALLSGRKDVVVISSVSCIYGMGNPSDFYNNVIEIRVGQKIDRNVFLRKLVGSLYTRNDAALSRGNFRVKGDTVEVSLAYSDHVLRITFWDDDIDSIEEVDSTTGARLTNFDDYKIYPANLFMTTKESTERAILEIEKDLADREDYFREIGKPFEAKRLHERVTYDIEMLRELGHCSGIENYSRYFDRRPPGSRPFCLIDYFPRDVLMVVDESHVTIPQVRAMYSGDRARKTNLVDFGFRLPAAIDNRPLKFYEYEKLTPTSIYVSATPAEYEIEKSGGVIIEQLIRPTYIVDPALNIKPSQNQIDDILDKLNITIKRGGKAIITTISKRSTEELSRFLDRIGIKNRYLHSDIDTLERVQILDDLREDRIDVLVGVKLLREGIDLPEVSLVIIVDADKEGFLRNTKSITQITGRAARNVNGTTILYADILTSTLRTSLIESTRRRAKQIDYNYENNCLPRTAKKSGTGQNDLLSDRTKEQAEAVKEAGEAALESLTATLERRSAVKHEIPENPDQRRKRQIKEVVLKGKKGSGVNYNSCTTSTDADGNIVAEGFSSYDTSDEPTIPLEYSTKMVTESIDNLIREAKWHMQRAAKALDFKAAAKYRDQMHEFERMRDTIIRD